MKTRQFRHGIEIKEGQAQKDALMLLEQSTGLIVREWSVDGKTLWADMYPRPSAKHLERGTCGETYLMLIENYLKPCPHCGETHHYRQRSIQWKKYPWDEEKKRWMTEHWSTPIITQETCRGTMTWKFEKEARASKIEIDNDPIPF